MKIVMIHHIKTNWKKEKKASPYANTSIVLPWQKSGSLAHSELPLLRKICKMTHKIFQSGCHYTYQLQMTTTSTLFGWQSSIIHQNNQQNLQFSKLYIISQNELALVSWEWVTYCKDTPLHAKPLVMLQYPLSQQNHLCCNTHSHSKTTSHAAIPTLTAKPLVMLIPTLTAKPLVMLWYPLTLQNHLNMLRYSLSLQNHLNMPAFHTNLKKATHLFYDLYCFHWCNSL